MERCLRSIEKQTYLKNEVIVIDNNSSDGTRTIAEKFGAKVISLSAERSAARNYGVTQSDNKAQFILFIDSDMELTPLVVEECVTACTRNDADAVIIPELSIAQNKLDECRVLEKELFEHGNPFAEIPKFFQKKTFQLIGGFDEDLVFGEHTDFDIRMRKHADCTVVRVRARILHHEGPLTWRKYVSEKLYYGKTSPRLLKKNFSGFAQRHPPLSPYMFSRRNLKVVSSNPSCLSILCLMEIVKYMAFCIGVFFHLIE